MSSQIGFFPRLYEDELLYSWMARYHVYSLNESPKKTMLDLFNKQSQVAVPDLPSNLSVFYSNISSFINISLNELIERHTFFLYYTQFNSLAQSNVLEIMKTSSKKGVLHLITGVAASGIKEKNYFYFCPQCFSNDINTIGETYWRIQHQLPGILVCTKHECELKESIAPFRPNNRHEFIAASDENCVLEEEKSRFTEAEVYHLLSIAKKIEHIFSTPESLCLSEVMSIYKDKLSEKGFLKPSGRVDQRLLSEKFINFYGEWLLMLLHSTVNYDEGSCWLKAITRKHRKAFHPLRHIILLNFLEEINIVNVNKYHPISPFGEGPYPCFNKAASHYMELAIKEVKVSVCSKTKKIISLFKCNCGFQYYAKEVEQNEGDIPLQISKIKEFGPVWMKELDLLINEKKYSYRRTASILGVDANTVIKYSKLSSDKSLPNGESNKTIILDDKKKTWLNLINNNPNKSINELRKINQSLYMYLYRNDRDWLKANYPRKVKITSKGVPRANWGERDEFYLPIIEQKIDELLEREPPVRITITRIGTELGLRSMLQKNIDKLPKTKKILNERVEAIDLFQIRRIKYVSVQMINNGEDLAGWKLKKLAGLGIKLEDTVEEFIDQIVN